MDGQLHLLAGGTGKHRFRLGPVIALSVLMEKRNVPDRSITVREPGIRNIFRHSRKFRICKVI